MADFLKRALEPLARRAWLDRWEALTPEQRLLRCEAACPLEDTAAAHQQRWLLAYVRELQAQQANPY